MINFNRHILTGIIIVMTGEKAGRRVKSLEGSEGKTKTKKTSQDTTRH